MFTQQSKQALASPALTPRGDALSQTWFRGTSVLGSPQPNPQVAPGARQPDDHLNSIGRWRGGCLVPTTGQNRRAWHTKKPWRAEKCLCNWEMGFSFSVILGKVKARPCKAKREDCLRKQSVILNNLLVIQPSQKNVPEYMGAGEGQACCFAQTHRPFPLACFSLCVGIIHVTSCILQEKDCKASGFSWRGCTEGMRN